MNLAPATEAAWQRIEEFLAAQRPLLPRAPEGVLRRPFVDPSSVYRGQLWDWDAYFTLLALGPYLDTATLARDCVLNFLDHQREDGSVPYVVTAASAEPQSRLRPAGSPMNSAKPVLAQMTALAAGLPGDWVAAALPAITRHVAHWEDTQRQGTGLFRWRSHRGSGADNHPGVYGRPLDSTAGVDLNCLMVREYHALAGLHELVGRKREAEDFADRAERLAEVVRAQLWDPVMGDFCHADTLSATPEGVRQEVDWLVPLRYRSWVGFWALWAGVATPGQARAVVERSDLFCAFGLRTLSPTEPLYNVAASSNPSNWQGPVWVVSNYLAFSGLLDYGYVERARQVLEGTVALLAGDLDRTGTLHEYYDPETGLGITGPGFLNWNLLVSTMHARFAEHGTG